MSQVHITSAVLALLLGLVVLLRPKGGAVHRAIGFAYVACMVALNVSALTIYHLTGRFGPFHAAAIFSLASVTAAVVMVERRRPNWMIGHAMWMMWSYVGLLAATASEIVVRTPLVRTTHGPRFVISLIVVNTAVFLGAWPLIERKRRAMSRSA